jgi:hypothetical protein
MSHHVRFGLIGGVMVLLAILARPTPAQAAKLFFSPAAASVTVGGKVTVTIRVDTEGQTINDSGGKVTFSTDVLALESVTTTDSIFDYWTVRPSADNTEQIAFAGGVPSPGYQGSSGIIFRVTWLAKRAGTATARIENSEVLANDGQGTDVLTSTENGTYTITALVDQSDLPIPTVTSPTYPYQDRWYEADQATLDWNTPSGLLGVSYTFDRLPTTVPDTQPDASAVSAIVTMSEDGDWYFHLRGRYEGGWSAATHFRLRHDQTPPDPFTVELIRNRSESDPTPQFAFRAVDVSSGIDRYTIRIDDQPASTAVSPVTVTLTQTGRHQATVTAFDRAGNAQENQIEFISSGYPPPTITSVSHPLILFQPLVVIGQASAGDAVTIFVDGQQYTQFVVGQVPVNNPTIHIRLPWSWKSDHVFGPGSHQVTASAMGSDNQVSVLTDPHVFNVNGATVTFRGRQVATIAMVPALELLLLAVVLGIGVILYKLFSAVYHLHRLDLRVETEVEILRQHVVRGDVSPVQVEQELENIEKELIRGRRKKRTIRPSAPTKKRKT